MKIQVLEEMLKLTIMQKQALNDEAFNQFENFTEKRQVLIDKINALNEEDKKEYTASERELLLKIKEIDTQNQHEFNRQYKEVKERLNKMRTEKRVADVYNNPYDISYEEGVFFDKK